MTPAPHNQARPDAERAASASASESISPTAHYTGYVWARNGLSHPELETVEGRVMYESMRLPMAAAGALGRPTLERYLLARHRAIDLLLERSIAEDGVTQVVEVAAGLSPRGWRFTERHPELVYVEADLPGMVERKRQALERMGSVSERHRVVELDALRPRGATSISGVARGLDHRSGLAIITEGLLSYLSREAVDGVWRRFAMALNRFSTGHYISDIQLEIGMTKEARAFRVLLGAFVRGQVNIHFQTATDVDVALHAAGFATASTRPASALLGVERSNPSRTHILEASTK
jgi:O-methyltransferase involved in polyketide biosynthesis